MRQNKFVCLLIIVNFILLTVYNVKSHYLIPEYGENCPIYPSTHQEFDSLVRIEYENEGKVEYVFGVMIDSRYVLALHNKHLSNDNKSLRIIVDAKFFILEFEEEKEFKDRDYEVESVEELKKTDENGKSISLSLIKTVEAIQFGGLVQCISFNEYDYNGDYNFMPVFANDLIKTIPDDKPECWPKVDKLSFVRLKKSNETTDKSSDIIDFYYGSEMDVCFREKKDRNRSCKINGRRKQAVDNKETSDFNYGYPITTDSFLLMITRMHSLIGFLHKPSCNNNHTLEIIKVEPFKDLLIEKIGPQNERCFQE